MTTATSPRFPRLELHSRVRAHLRAIALVLLCAALTYGFLSQVWNGPTQQEIEAYACNPQVERCA